MVISKSPAFKAVIIQHGTKQLLRGRSFGVQSCYFLRRQRYSEITILKFFKCIQAKLLPEDALREIGGNLLYFCGLQNYIILLIASFTSNGGTRVCTGSKFYEEAMYINA